MHAVGLDMAGRDHGAHAGNEIGGEVEAQLDMVDAQIEDFADHGFAGFVAACVPAGCQAEDHDGLKQESSLKDFQGAFRDSKTESDVVRRASARTGCLAAALLAGLLEVTMGTDLLHDPFLVHDLLEASHRLVHGFAASNFHLCHV